MKTRLALSTLASAAASSLLFAADNTPTSSSVDLPVTRIEVTVALKQYEKVQSLLMDAELDRKLQNADPNIAKENGAALEVRIEAGRWDASGSSPLPSIIPNPTE